MKMIETITYKQANFPVIKQRQQLQQHLRPLYNRHEHNPQDVLAEAESVLSNPSSDPTVLKSVYDKLENAMLSNSDPMFQQKIELAKESVWKKLNPRGGMRSLWQRHSTPGFQTGPNL